MLDPGPCVYMEKLVTDNEAAHAVDIERPIEENIREVAAAKGKAVHETTVIMLDRPRHEDAIKRIRELGARIRFITDGDVSAALLAARQDSPVDILYGIGGSPEGVLTACAIRCLGGQIQARLWPRDAAERQAAVDLGYDVDRVLLRKDLVKGDNIFFAATGVTDGDMLQGVRYGRYSATTESLIMRSRSGTVRTVRSEHNRGKLSALSGGRYFAGQEAAPLGV